MLAGLEAVEGAAAFELSEFAPWTGARLDLRTEVRGDTRLGAVGTAGCRSGLSPCWGVTIVTESFGRTDTSGLSGSTGA